MISGLSKVKKQDLRPSVKIDLSDFAEEECFVELREPDAAALFPDASFLNQLKIKFPDYPESMLYQIALLGKCYVPNEKDPESYNAVQDFGQLAKNNKECFYYVLSTFLAAFPTVNLDEKVTQAKND